MKKRVLFAATALLTVGALAMLTGCGEKTGEISGKYKEATTDEVAAACDKIDFEKSLGDVTADGWGFNFQAEGKTTSKIDLDMNVKESGQVMNFTYKLEGSDSFNYFVSLSSTEDGITSVGAGNSKTKSEGAVAMSGLSFSLDADEEWNLYHDGDTLFVEPLKESKIFSSKSKISIGDIMDEIGGSLPEIPDVSDPDFPELPELPETPEIPDVSVTDLKTAIDELTAMGVKVSLDQRDGLKMKFSIGKETAEKLLAQAGEEEGVEINVEYKTFEIDVYVAFDENGMFEAAGIVFDIDISLQIASSEVAVGGRVIYEGGYSVKVTDKQAQLPDGISTDKSFKPLDMNDILGPIMGGIGAGSPAPDWDY